MRTELEDLEILQIAEGIADRIWKNVLKWNHFERDTIGKQLTRSADSIGANISESYGRYHFGEKIRFTYYARGSLFEIKYWLNRTTKRNLIPEQDSEWYGSQLTILARKLNSFIGNLKYQQSSNRKKKQKLKEAAEDYQSHIDYEVDQNKKMELDAMGSNDLVSNL